MANKTVFLTRTKPAAVLAIAAAVLMLALGSPAEAGKRKPVKYYFSSICGHTKTCFEDLMEIAEGKRFEIKDLSCEAGVKNAGIPLRLSIKVIKDSHIKSRLYLVPEFVGVSGPHRLYVSGRLVNIPVGPKQRIELDGYASEEFAGVACSLTGDMVKLK